MSARSIFAFWFLGLRPGLLFCVCQASLIRSLPRSILVPSGFNPSRSILPGGIFFLLQILGEALVVPWLAPLSGGALDSATRAALAWLGSRLHGLGWKVCFVFFLTWLEGFLC